MTPAKIAQAIERTGATYVAKLQVTFDQIGALNAARLADKDDTIAAQAETVAELRRRAEAAEQALTTLPRPAVVLRRDRRRPSRRRQTAPSMT